MGRPRKWENDAERKRFYRAKNPGLDKRKRPGKGAKELPFITIDGEAIGESGYHLLAASTGDEIANPEGLSSADCLRFLLDLKAKHGSAVYCGYALGYDCEHWIRDFGPDLWRSFKETGEGNVRIKGRSYTLQYIPRKWFKIGYYKGDRFIPHIEVFDVFSFFQASFVATVGSPETGQKKGWGAATPEEMAVLTEWKEKRGEFRLEDWEDIRAYNQIECSVLVRLMEKLRTALLSADIRLSSWHGPGAVANVLLRRHGMGEHIEKNLPPEAVEAIACAYFGGRFQVFKFGHIEGVYDYDISSAYPYATTLLPSTRGTWQKVEGYQGDDAPWTVYLVSWKTDASAGDLTPFPWRDANGIIHYPCYGKGWYWGWEVAACLRTWGDAIRVEMGWRLYPEEEGIFGWMNELASKRVEAKQHSKTTCGEERERWQGIERAYKLALNSVYGKTIQTVGSHRPFLCPMWAGLITSHCRARLMDAASAAPHSLVCFATDGLFSSAANPAVVTGSNLGDWSLEEKDIRLELYQSGCYAIFKGDEMLDSRFRGVARADVPWNDLRKLWKKKGCAGKMMVPTKRFVGHRTALQRNKPELQCKWDATPKEVLLAPGTGFPMPGNPVPWYSALPHVDYNEVSARYRKLPAGETDFELDEASVQP